MHIQIQIKAYNQIQLNIYVKENKRPEMCISSKKDI